MKKQTQFNLGDLQELSQALASTAHVWVPQMFPNGHRVSRDWRIGDIDGSKGMSTSIRLSGDKAGCFIDHAAGDVIGGGPLELIRCAYNLTFPQAVERALEIVKKPMPKYQEDKTDEEYAARDEARVRALYGKRKVCKNTVVEDYLASRGLPRSGFDDIFFHPNLPHWPEKTNLPAMLGVVRNKDAEVIGIHRTFLDKKIPRKAEVVPAKMMLGNVNGGAVRLFAARQKVGIAEGIETAMAANKLFGIPVWAALSCSGMMNVEFPDHIKEVIICADHDEAGIAAATKLQKRLTETGILVSVAIPRQAGWDFNDQLLQEGR